MIFFLEGANEIWGDLAGALDFDENAKKGDFFKVAVDTLYFFDLPA